MVCPKPVGKENYQLYMGVAANQCVTLRGVQSF